MIRSHVIDISGVFAGAAIQTSDRYRFVAVDPRLEALNQSEFPSLADIRRAAALLMTTGPIQPDRSNHYERD